jgi:integrase
MAARRRSNFGQIRKLPSGRYQARYTIPGTEQFANAPHTFDTKGDADTWLTTVRADLARGTWQPPRPKAKPLTFTEYADRWLTERDLKPRTRDHYKIILERFLTPTFGTAALTEITPQSVATWHATLTTGKTYRAHAYSLLRTITRDAVAHGLIAASPCVIRGAGTSHRSVKIRPASLDELQRAAAAMPEQYQLLVLLAAWTALRFGELSELRRKDIDVKDQVIRVRRGVTFVDGKPIVGPPKSDAGKRDVAIPPHLLPAIKAHLKQHAQWGKDGLVFPSPRGAHLTSGTLYEHWWPAREAAGRPDLRFHDLRHTGAVLAAQTGATLAELMGRLGHSTPAAALRYQHAAQGRDAIIAAKLSELANGGTTK